MPKKGISSSPIVFISYSHRDRHTAVDLQRTIAEYGAKTYLDQERINPGDPLTEEIRDLITSCNTFLLIWSASAASSRWVQREWKMAYESREKKKIVPYCLDRSPLPPELEDLVHIDSKDREHGDAELLTTIFDRKFTPSPTTLFPGHWRASVNIGGIMEATYDLELRKNGQVEGTGGLSHSALTAPGAGDLMKMRIPFHGRWSYDRGAKILTIESVVTATGREDRETIRVHATGREKGAITGQDLGGCIWTLWRVDVMGDVSPRGPSTTWSKERETTRAPSDAYAIRPSQEEVNKMAELYESWHAAQGEEDLTLLTELLIREAVGKHLKTLGKSGREVDEADFEEVIAMARQIGLLR